MRATADYGPMGIKQKNVMGMAFFIASEAGFFGLLIISYIYFQGGVAQGNSASKVLDPALTAIFTLFLLSSSVTMWMAGRSVERGNHRGTTLWLVVTVVFGAVFLIGQGMEYARLLSISITVGRNLFGTTFFTLTGFHGLHVFVGLLMISILAGMSMRGHFKGTNSSAIEAVSLYWHFVDLIWVILFSMIYIWGYNNW